MRKRDMLALVIVTINYEKESNPDKMERRSQN